MPDTTGEASLLLPSLPQVLIYPERHINGALAPRGTPVGTLTLLRPSPPALPPTWSMPCSIYCVIPLHRQTVACLTSSRERHVGPSLVLSNRAWGCHTHLCAWNPVFSFLLHADLGKIA